MQHVRVRQLALDPTHRARRLRSRFKLSKEIWALMLVFQIVVAVAIAIGIALAARSSDT